MNDTIKHLSDTKVELTITVEAGELSDAKKVALTKLAKDMKIPGFRKGKVPTSAVEKNIDPHKLEDEIINNALSKAVADTFLAKEIQVLERPAVEVKKYVPGESLEFTATAEVLPKVKLGNYKKLKAKLETSPVEAKDVDEIIERMRTGFAAKEDVKRATKDGDETVIDFIGKKDGVAFEGGTGKDYNLVLGSNSFIPGFEAGVVGHKVNDEFDIELEFPKDYHAADLKGAKVTFTVTLKEIKQVKLPEVNDEFAAKAGPFTSVKELKDDIKRELKSQKEREAKEKLKDELVSQLIEISEIPIPEVLITDQSSSIEQDFERNLTYQGLSIDQYLENKGFKDKADWQEREVKPSAIKRVKAGLVLAELSKAENIEASTQELEEHIEMYKKQYANNKDALAQFETPEVRRDVASRLITEKTVDRLVELSN